MEKFYNFTGKDELYIYGDIISTVDKYEETDINFIDFKNKLEEMEKDSVLNIYINSGGGSVIATQGIIGLLNKAKRDKGIKTKCFIDGLAGSCASWLPMVCDEVFCYNTSLLMVHKPMIGFYMEMLNANELQKTIEVLDKIEESMLNAYESKLKNATREEIKAMINEETWLTSNEICDLFNVTLLEDNKELVAKVSDDVLKNYKHVPDSLRNSLNKEDDEEVTEDEVTEDEVTEDEKTELVEEEAVNNEATSSEEEPGSGEEEADTDEESEKEAAAEKELQNKIKILNLELELINLF